MTTVYRALRMDYKGNPVAMGLGSTQEEAKELLHKTTVEHGFDEYDDDDVSVEMRPHWDRDRLTSAEYNVSCVVEIVQAALDAEASNFDVYTKDYEKQGGVGNNDPHGVDLKATGLGSHYNEATIETRGGRFYSVLVVPMNRPAWWDGRQEEEEQEHRQS